MDALLIPKLLLLKFFSLFLQINLAGYVSQIFLGNLNKLAVGN